MITILLEPFVSFSTLLAVIRPDVAETIDSCALNYCLPARRRTTPTAGSMAVV
jgi:hypothetical protein